MSDIKVGDLVMVLHHCCEHEQLGVVGSVKSLYVSTGKCPTCGTYFELVPAAMLVGVHPTFAVSWLKRIPPLSELDDVKQDGEIHA